MRLQNKIILSLYLQWLAGITGGMIVAIIHFRKGNYLLGLIHFALWGICFKYGVYGRDWIRKSMGKPILRVTPSWSSALIAALIVTGALFKASGIESVNDWLLVVLSINIAYLGAKYKCFVYRCCDVKLENSKKQLLKKYRLPVFEILVTLTIILGLVIVINFDVRPSKLLGVILFSCHILLRYYCSLLRFSSGNSLSFANYTICVPVILFAFFIW